MRVPTTGEAYSLDIGFDEYALQDGICDFHQEVMEIKSELYTFMGRVKYEQQEEARQSDILQQLELRLQDCTIQLSQYGVKTKGPTQNAFGYRWAFAIIPAAIASIMLLWLQLSFVFVPLRCASGPLELYVTLDPTHRGAQCCASGPQLWAVYHRGEHGQLAAALRREMFNMWNKFAK